MTFVIAARWVTALPASARPILESEAGPPSVSPTAHDRKTLIVSK